MIDPSTLQRLLTYDPESGRFFWKERTPDLFRDTRGVVKRRTAEHSCKQWNLRYAGKEAFLASNLGGYRKGQIKFGDDNTTYSAHCVAWALYYGRWPAKGALIDHINRVRTDNRIANLREVSPSGNSFNATRRSDNKSGVSGVSWYPPSQKWRAVITIGRRQRSLGHFASFEDAVAARRKAAAELEAVLFGQTA